MLKRYGIEIDEWDWGAMVVEDKKGKFVKFNELTIELKKQFPRQYKKILQKIGIENASKV